MPRHQHVTTCLKEDAPVSKYCSCHHCTLAICEVCGAYEGGLTTDCPGEKVDFDRQKEVFETRLDYTDERGWHLGDAEWPRSPRFEKTPRFPAPPDVDPRTTVAPAINWTAVDRHANLQKELSQKAMDWVLADRDAADRSALCTRLEDEIDARRGRDPDARSQALQDQLEDARSDFLVASAHAEKCDDAMRQAARSLVAGLENKPPLP